MTEWTQKMNELSTKEVDTSAKQQEEGPFQYTPGKSAGEEDEHPEVDDDDFFEALTTLQYDSASEDEPTAVVTCCRSPMSSTCTKHVTPTTIFKNG